MVSITQPNSVRYTQFLYFPITQYSVVTYRQNKEHVYELPQTASQMWCALYCIHEEWICEVQHLIYIHQTVHRRHHLFHKVAWDNLVNIPLILDSWYFIHHYIHNTFIIYLFCFAPILQTFQLPLIIAAIVFTLQKPDWFVSIMVYLWSCLLIMFTIYRFVCIWKVYLFDIHNSYGVSWRWI